MDGMSDWLPTIMVTAMVTVLLVTAALRSQDCHREPQIIYVQTVSTDARNSGTGCLPLATLILFVLLLLALQAPV
jgi:hypothetical protein